jgi:hypothetical protein
MEKICEPPLCNERLNEKPSAPRELAPAMNKWSSEDLLRRQPNPNVNPSTLGARQDTLSGVPISIYGTP